MAREIAGITWGIQGPGGFNPNQAQTQPGPGSPGQPIDPDMPIGGPDGNFSGDYDLNFDNADLNLNPIDPDMPIGGPGGYPTPTLKSVKPYEPSGGALVEDRMAGLLEKGSPYLTAARNRALGTANKRGLLNTTMAAGAGEQAAIESALPIASQDAAAFHEAKMAGYQGDINSWLAEQGYGHDIGLAEQGYGHDIGIIGAQEAASSNLSAQDAAQAQALSTLQAGQAAGLSAQEAAQAAGLSVQEAEQLLALSQQQADQAAQLSQQQSDQAAEQSIQDAAEAARQSALDAGETAAQAEQDAAAAADLQTQINDANKEMKQIGIDAEKEVAAMQLGAAQTATFGTQLGNLQHDASMQIMAIQSSDMEGPEKNAAIAQVMADYTRFVDELTFLYGGEVDWIDPNLNTATGLTISAGGSNYTLGSDNQFYADGQPTGAFVGENNNFLDANGDPIPNWSWNADGTVNLGGTSGTWASG